MIRSKGTVLIIVFIGFFMSLCASDDSAYNPDGMPNFNAPGEPGTNPPIHEEPKGEGPEYRWHKIGFKYPYKRKVDGGGFCIMCHGNKLQGSDLEWGKPPSCFTCHDKKWDEAGKDTIDSTIGTRPSDPLPPGVTFTYGSGMPKYDPPLGHIVPKPPPLKTNYPMIFDSNYRWHKIGFYKPMNECSPEWTCICCHGPTDLTGSYNNPYVGSGTREQVVYRDPNDADQLKNPPSCYTCHNKAWDG